MDNETIDAEKLHPMHCFNCGTQLHEIELEFLECDRCKSQFYTSKDMDGNQSLTQVEREDSNV